MTYLHKLAKALNGMRKENQLCDVVIQVDGRAFNAHKAVLAACSNYFEAMFTSGFRESSESKITIEGKPEIFEILLEYAYTGQLLNVKPENAYDVLEMACYMQFIDASTDCATSIKIRFMGSGYYSTSATKMPIGDVLKVSELARNHDHLKQLALIATRFLCDNLPELKKCDIFLQNATDAFLKWFLRQQELPSRIHSEKDVLEMVVCWLKHDWENRAAYTYPIFQYVRLGLVKEEQLIKLVDDEMRKIPECNQLIDLVLKEQKLGRSKEHLVRKLPHLFATRSTITAPVLFVPDDDVGTDDCRLHYYSVTYKEWKQLPSMYSLTWLPSVMNIHGKLYAIGGIEEEWEYEQMAWSDSDSFDYWDDYDYENRERELIDSHCEKRCSFFSAKENHRWKNLTQLPSARQHILLVHVNGFIYAIAGMDERAKPVCVVERYDFSQKKWETLAVLPSGFKWVSAVAFKDKVLVYGVSESVTNCSRKHVIVAYIANKNVWQIKLSEQCIDSGKSPVLFVFKDQCFRVLYQEYKDPSAQSKSCYVPIYKNYTASVTKLEMQSRRNGVSLATGEEIQQDFIPANDVGAFRIDKRVFVNRDGIIFKTYLKIGEDQSASISLDAFHNFSRYMQRRCSNLTTYTFDWRKTNFYNPYC